MIPSSSLFVNEILHSKEFSQLEKAYRNGRLPAIVWGAFDAVRAPAVAALCSGGESSLIIVPEGASEKTKKLLYPFFGEKIAVFPSKDYVFSELEKLSFDEIKARTAALSRLSEGGWAVITTAEAAMQFTTPSEEFAVYSHNLGVGLEQSFDELTACLVLGGYRRTDRVEGVGQFARRGDVFDIWSPLYSDPARIEFFDIEIEKISLFDPFTQRKKKKLDSLNIVPVTESILSEERVGAAVKMISRLKNANNIASGNDSIAEACENLKIHSLPNSSDRYIPALFSEKKTIFDYLSGCKLFVFEHRAVFDNAKNFSRRTEEDIKQAIIDGRSMLKGDYYLSENELYSRLETCKAVILDTLTDGINAVTVKETVSMNLQETAAWHGSLDILSEDVRFYLSKGYRVAVCSANALHTEKIRARLAADIPTEPVTTAEKMPEKIGRGVTIAVSAVSSGWANPVSYFAAFADRSESAKLDKKAPRRIRDTRQITSVELLKKGDYIVHSDYGIGVYEGVVTSSSEGVNRDMMKICYSGTDVLYVPCDRLDLVSKYTGADATSGGVKLSKLGGTDWQNAKAKVRAAVKQLAFDLTSLYSERMKTQGYAFTPDTVWQREFEESFQYDETDDQLKAIAEVKSDMERPVAMDRLLCGDVGVGKTEVALRAVFKCVSDGKQAAVLVPTTVLALQHLRTFSARMADYPVKVEMLSRFVPDAERKRVVKRLKTGETDVVIGTHSLIQKNIVFKDLGLLVIDEEQRFGVGHKEQLKEKYRNVDCLTMSATPIPRTLNMALSGIRDMSIIEDYPEDRQPIKTYMAEYDASLAADAIMKELARGGQVYYLHNRVDTIYGEADRLSQLLPGVRVDVAHGQMNEEQLSGAWDRLLKKETDVLVCTTIIETGVDVPNVNTIIIDDADNLGLAQLHQIRGRVGRSARRAYCYLLYRKGKILTEEASKRLNAIKEFTEFGAGLKIALRDLELRGAGSVLGANQHGHIANVGYDMYMRLLEGAVAEQRGEKQKPDCTVELRVNAILSSDYVPNIDDRIVLYKRISSIEELFEADELRDELEDRFGSMPEEAESLIRIAEIRVAGRAAGVVKITEEGEGRVALLFADNDFELFSKLCSQYSGNTLFFRPAPSPRLVFTPGKNRLESIVKLLELAFSYAT